MRILLLFLLFFAFLSAGTKEERNPSIIDGIDMGITRQEVKQKLAKLDFKILKETDQEMEVEGYVPLFRSRQKVRMFFMNERLAACSSAQVSKNTTEAEQGATAHSPQ